MSVEKSESFVPGTAEPAEPTKTRDVHSCGYHCERPACVLAQRNELRDRLAGQSEPPSVVAALRRVVALRDMGATLKFCKLFGLEQVRIMDGEAAVWKRVYDDARAALQTPTKESQPRISPPPSAETMALARKAVEAQRNDKRTPEQIASDGAAFIMGGRNDTRESRPRKLTPERQEIVDRLRLWADSAATSGAAGRIMNSAADIIEGQSIAAPDALDGPRFRWLLANMWCRHEGEFRYWQTKLFKDGIPLSKAIDAAIKAEHTPPTPPSEP